MNTVERWEDELRIVEVDVAWQSYPSNEIEVETPAVSTETTGSALLVNDLEEIRDKKERNILEAYEHVLGAQDVKDALVVEVALLEVGCAQAVWQPTSYLAEEQTGPGEDPEVAGL